MTKQAPPTARLCIPVPPCQYSHGTHFDPDTTSLEDLAQLADKIVEVAIPSVAVVHTSSPLNVEVEQL